MSLTIPGFRYERIAVADGVMLNTAIGGSGSPIVLLHGFPQTHLMWRHVAAALAGEHTVICPDLRGYGDSDKPAEDGPGTYSKRAMAADIVTLAKTLGHDRFALAGHDRGALVAIRAGLDHPASVSHLAALDVLPTLDMWSVLHGADAAVAFHLYLMAQPPGLPEQMISASADAFFGYFLDTWAQHPGAIPDDVRAEYLRASREAVPSIVADYRATAGIDIEHDQADRAAGRVLVMPLTVVQQDWGAALGYDATGLWRPWGPRLPAIKASLGIDTAAIGLLLAGVTVGAILGLLASTPVLHWLGSRRSVAGVLLLIAAAMTVMGLALILRSVPLVAVAFVIIGMGIGTLDVLINVEGSAVERAAGRTLMPMMHAAWSIGAAVGSGIGAACAALGVTPSAQFIAEALIIAAAALGTVAGIPHGRCAPAGQPPQDRGAKLRQWLRGWLDWRLLLIGVVMLGVELGEGSANNWLTLAVRNDHGQTAAVAAMFFTVFAAGEALARIFGAPIVDRLGRARTIRVTTALGIIGVALFIQAGNRWIVLVGVLLWAVGVSMGFPLGMSAAAESGPDPAARVSVVASIGYFANLAGPPVIGALAQSAGLLNALWLIAALFLAAFAAASSLRSRPAVPEPADALSPGT